jgi:tetratricopeptide (TPR) repeat protein
LGRGFWSRCAIVSLALLAVSPAAIAQTFDEAKALFDAGDWRASAEAFEAASQTDAAHRPEAAAFILRAYANAGDHAAVTGHLDACLSAARSTPFGPQCLLEVARSTWQNAKDTTGALEQLSSLLARFPDDPVAAPGALYHRGIVERDGLKAPSVAYQTFEECVRRFPDSPYAADALVAECRTGIALRDLALIDSARARLGAMNADGAHIQEAQFERAEFYNQVRRDRDGALAEYAKVVAPGLPADTAPALLAKTRAADLVPGGDFTRSIALYREVADNPKAPRRVRQWSVLNTGIFQFVLGDEAAARATLEAFVATEPPKSFEAQARQFLDGMANPETTTAIAIHFEKATHLRRSRRNADLALWALDHTVALSRSPFFERWVTDSSVDREQRAQMLYRVAFARYFAGHGNDAAAICDRILSDIQPGGVTKYECMYMKAFLAGRSGEWDRAARGWELLIAADPPYYFRAEAYLHYSQALDRTGDTLGAVLALHELTVRFPARKEADEARARMAGLLKRNPALAPEVEAATPRIIAKWKSQPRAPATEPDAYPAVPETAQPAAAGGAQ